MAIKISAGRLYFEGFGLMNLYDATSDVTLSKIRSVFIRNDKGVFDEFKELVSNLMGIKNLHVGYSVYDTEKKQALGNFMNKDSKSLFLEANQKMDYKEMFCDGVNACVMMNSKILAIPDVELYGKMTGGNYFYEKSAKRALGV